MSSEAPYNEAFSSEDAAYAGSRFAVVREALFANPYQEVWGRAANAQMPEYRVTLGGVLQGILPLGRPYAFREASARAVDSSADLRWGSDLRGYRRLLHPNGICLTGTWSISEETGYSGYFRKGSRALALARYSTCCRQTRRGRVRSLSMVGKLFPTVEREHTAPLRTANFITQQDIGGDYTDYINDAELRNAPDTTIWRRGFGAPILLVTGILFGIVDRKPCIRQLYPIAELAKPSAEPTRAPTFMRFRVDNRQPRIPGRRNARAPGGERRTFRNWRKIGTLAFDEAVASYNGDFVIHFTHPTWRDDQNDPATATRAGRKKVR